MPSIGNAEWRSRGANFALFVGSLVLFGLLAEAGVRLLGLAPQVERLHVDQAYGSFVTSDDPILRYVPRAGFGDINRSGFRDREYSMEKPPDVFRIVVIGD